MEVRETFPFYFFFVMECGRLIFHEITKQVTVPQKNNLGQLCIISSINHNTVLSKNLEF